MITFIGFKHVGKSTLGRALAESMDLEFTDLDELLEHQHLMSPRELMKKHGAERFRELERLALLEVDTSKGILAVGGGTPIHNADLLQDHTCVHITADPDQVFEWIKAGGFPPFFSEEDPRQSFDQLWIEHIPHYEALATHSIHNTTELPLLIAELKTLLK